MFGYGTPPQVHGRVLAAASFCPPQCRHTTRIPGCRDRRRDGNRGGHAGASTPGGPGHGDGTEQPAGCKPPACDANRRRQSQQPALSLLSLRSESGRAARLRQEHALKDPLRAKRVARQTSASGHARNLRLPGCRYANANASRPGRRVGGAVRIRNRDGGFQIDSDEAINTS